MAIYVNDTNKVVDIFVKVNNKKQKIKSAWVNKDGVATKVFLKSKNDVYTIAPENAYINWQYVLDEENGTIGLRGYDGNEKNVIVYDSYQINGKTYRTKVLGAETWYYPDQYYMFSKSSSVETIIFGNNIDFSEDKLPTHVLLL